MNKKTKTPMRERFARAVVDDVFVEHITTCGIIMWDDHADDWFVLRLSDLEYRAGVVDYMAHMDDKDIPSMDWDKYLNLSKVIDHYLNYISTNGIDVANRGEEDITDTAKDFKKILKAPL